MNRNGQINQAWSIKGKRATPSSAISSKSERSVVTRRPAGSKDCQFSDHLRETGLISPISSPPPRASALGTSFVRKDNDPELDQE